MRVSILAMAFLPPLRAFCSASSRRDWASLTWASSSFLSLSSIMAASCSARSSSASLAASIMDLWAFSSDILASEVISSRSWPRLFISASHLLLAPLMAWLVQVCWDRVSLVSASSCSIILLFLSDCSSRVRASSRAFWLALTLLSAAIRASWAALLALTSSSYLAWTSRMVAWILLMFLWLSALAALACSRATPRSTTSVSSFFFILRASTLPLVSPSSSICMPSMALAKFFLVAANSSSFWARRRSISCLTWVSSREALSTLFSSCSRAPSASDRAASSSIFSASSLFLILSISWMERPPSVIWSRMSLISLERVLFSLLTSSSWIMASS